MDKKHLAFALAMACLGFFASIPLFLGWVEWAFGVVISAPKWLLNISEMAWIVLIGLANASAWMIPRY